MYILVNLQMLRRVKGIKQLWLEEFTIEENKNITENMGALEEALEDKMHTLQSH